MLTEGALRMEYKIKDIEEKLKSKILILFKAIKPKVINIIRISKNLLLRIFKNSSIKESQAFNKVKLFFLKIGLFPAVCLVVISVLLVGTGGYYFFKLGSNVALPDSGIEVSIITLASEKLSVPEILPGRTSAFRVAEIRPQVSGIILKRLFEEGSDVKEGQQLYQIDPATYQASYDSAKADLQKAEANLKAIQAKATRYSELVKIGGVSKQDYDDIKATLAQNKAEVAIAKASLATAKINLDYTKVFSPISGRIGKSSVTEGALVTANQAASLATVQQLDRVYVDVTQPSRELINFHSYQGKTTRQAATASLLLEGEEKTYSYEGTLKFSDVTVDQGTDTIQIRILFPNPHYELLPGLFVRAKINKIQDDNALLVPQKAVTRYPDQSTKVFVVNAQNRAELRTITISQDIKDKWIVVSGLKFGEKVIVEGNMKIKPGSLVKPVEINPEANPKPLLKEAME